MSYFRHFPKETPRGYGVELVFPVEDIDSFYSQIVAKLGEQALVKPLMLKPWGLRDFRLTDPFGYYLRFTEPVDLRIKPAYTPTR